MKVYLPGLFERLMGERDQVKDKVAREFDVLRDTRDGAPPAPCQAWPPARDPVLQPSPLHDAVRRAARPPRD